MALLHRYMHAVGSAVHDARGQHNLCQLGQRKQRRRQRNAVVHATLRVFDASDVELEQPLGTLGFMKVSSYRPSAEADAPLTGLADGLGLQGMQRLSGQEVQEGGITARLYTGRILRGELMGARVVLKAYPRSSQREADAMAANELTAHAALQPPSVAEECPQLCKLLGGFQVRGGASAGEQWLVFRNTGTITAAQYAAKAADAGARRVAVGPGEFWDMMEPGRALLRRRAFVVRVLQQTMRGLAFMHARQRLHQSIGPTSVVLSTMDETKINVLDVRLRDLAFAVDVSEEALFGGPTLGEVWEQQSVTSKANPLKELSAGLWDRARWEGAQTQREKRNFGIADDVYAAGMLLAYLAFLPFCAPGSIDAAALQRLLEGTFRLDVAAAREYCAADDNWAEAVALLDAGKGAGWELLQAMLNPNWRLRPTAESCLKHPFLNGAAFEPPGAQS